MKTFQEIQTPTEIQALVGFFDLTAFAQSSRRFSTSDLFGLLSDYYEWTGDLIESSGGRIIKFIGDAGLVLFPKTEVNAGVLAFKRLKEEGDKWIAQRGMASKHIVKLHYGPVICGPLGTRSHKQLDVIGMTVNTAALLKSNGFAMSAQVFRQLQPDVRKLFKKHTPPITYIPLTERHQTSY